MPRVSFDNYVPEQAPEFEFDENDLPYDNVGIQEEVGECNSSLWTWNLNIDDNKNAITDIIGVKVFRLDFVMIICQEH